MGKKTELLSCLFGFGALFVRLYELEHCFDAEGLPLRTFPYLPALLLLCAAVLFLLARRLPPQDRLIGDFSNFFRFERAGALFGAVCGALLLIAAAVLSQILQPIPSAFRLLMSVFLALCGAAVLYIVVALRKKSRFAPTALLAPVCYLVVQLILVYRDNAKDPVLAHYYPLLLALAALCLSFLFLAAFAFRNGAPRLYVPLTNLALILSMAALADLFTIDLSQAAALLGFLLVSASFLDAADFAL